MLSDGHLSSMPKDGDQVKRWLEIKQCIDDVNKATASLQLALACSGEVDEFVAVSLTKRQIALLIVLLGKAFE
jgi:hypothetical protein